MSVVSASPKEEWVARYAGATREIYRKWLLETAQRDSRIFCLDSDTGGLEDTFGAVLPNQYADLGIAEANLMSVAAGLAASGKRPFVNTMATFATARACEQVKLDIAYNNLAVTIVGTHSGVSAGHLGPTHHSLEDVAIMRSLPNLTVIVPSDTVETVKALEASLNVPGPVYIRLGRRPTDLVHEADYPFQVGRAELLRPGTSVTIIAAGSYPILIALEVHKLLAALGYSVRVLNMHTIKPLDVEAIIAAACETRAVVTIEEHSIIGGLGSAVAEALAEHAPVPLKRIGVPDRFCDYVGNQAELLGAYGISVDSVMDAALKLIQDKPIM